VILIGNKCDLEEYREITTDDGQELATRYNWKFFEGSAKTGFHVVDAFEEIVRTIKLDRLRVTNTTKGIKEGDHERKRKCVLI